MADQTIYPHTQTHIQTPAPPGQYQVLSQITFIYFPFNNPEADWHTHENSVVIEASPHLRRAIIPKLNILCTVSTQACTTKLSGNLSGLDEYFSRSSKSYSSKMSTSFWHIISFTYFNPKYRREKLNFSPQCGPDFAYSAAPPAGIWAWSQWKRPRPPGNCCLSPAIRQVASDSSICKTPCGGSHVTFRLPIIGTHNCIKNCPSSAPL